MNSDVERTKVAEGNFSDDWLTCPPAKSSPNSSTPNRAPNNFFSTELSLAVTVEDKDKVITTMVIRLTILKLRGLAFRLSPPIGTLIVLEPCDMLI